MHDEQAWKRVAEFQTPENVPVLTKIDDAQGCSNERVLVRRGRLYWTEDKVMYVYYTPTHWRPIADVPPTPRPD